MKKRNLYTKVFALVSSLVFCFNSMLSAQKFFELDFLSPSEHNVGWLKYSDAPNFLYHHISDRAFVLLEKRKAHCSEIDTPEKWQQRQEELKEAFTKLSGPLPEKKPLNAKVLSVIDKGDYRIENILYESRPSYYVSASLFVPEKAKNKKNPAIIYCSGHSFTGYRGSTYQHIIINLVKKGFVVLAFDPQGQGERLEYFDPKTGEPYFGQRPTRQHSYPGAQVLITGKCQANYMIWDGMRAVDYLVSRKEVDPARIGITGRSGGGTQSAIIAAYDERIYAAAPEAYITSYKRLFESIGPQDAEQNLYGMIKNGADLSDLLIIRAPRPALVITTTNDFFSMQGARETLDEVKEIYKSYNKADHVSMVEDYGKHESTRKNREAMYAFFQKHLNNPGSAIDEDVELPDAEELKVTATGQVQTALKSETVFSQNKRDAEQLWNKLNETRQNPELHLNSVIKSAKSLSGYWKPEDIEEPVFAGQILRNDYIIERYLLKGEGNYVIPYLLMLPEKTNNKALIYLHPDGKSAEANENGEIEDFVRTGFIVLAPDLIGTGEIGPGIFKGDANIEGVSYNQLFAANLIGRSIVGIRAGDVSRLVQVLAGRKEVNEIGALSRAEMSSVLIHAAAFDPLISKVAMIEPLVSYHSLVTEQYYKPAFVHGIVPGSHLKYDLPDLAACIAPRKLLFLNAVDGAGKPAGPEMINREMNFTRVIFQMKDVADSLVIESTDNISTFITDWMN